MNRLFLKTQRWILVLIFTCLCNYALAQMSGGPSGDPDDPGTPAPSFPPPDEETVFAAFQFPAHYLYGTDGFEGPWQFNEDGTRASRLVIKNAKTQYLVGNLHCYEVFTKSQGG